MSRTPIIAANIGALPEVVADHKNGLLFETGSIDDLKAKINLLVSNPHMIPEMAAAIKPVQTLERQVSELTSLYRDLMQRNQNR